MFDISGLWDPKFKITPKSKVATFGSCFAQHFGNALKSRGFNWFLSELPPPGLSKKNQTAFNYNVFSARTGNIYTTSLLRQWVEWALEKNEVPSEVWEKNKRYHDPFRPTVEPNGFFSIDELRASQVESVRSFRECIKSSNFFVFTLGLTESWFNAKEGYEYPMCPGTSAGSFSEDEHIFKNQNFNEIRKELALAIKYMRQENPSLKFILTVSPVPLIATKSGRNVIVATMESKSILRAVAGQFSESNRAVDYFPSYEIINSPVFKGVFFEPNARNVSKTGVNFVMDNFFSDLLLKYPEISNEIYKGVDNNMDYLIPEEVCDEEILNSFGGDRK